MIDMNSWERFNRLLGNQSIDRVPVHPLLMTFAARYAGVPYRSYVADYRLLVDAQLRAAEKFGVECVTVCSDPCREAADCGADVLWFDDQPPTTNPHNHLIKDKSNLSALKQPEILGGGRMHDRVNAVSLFREKIGGDLPIVGWIEGPIAQAADLRGLNEVMMDLIDDPQFVVDMFEFVTPMEIAFAKAQIEAGADIIGIGDAAASLVGPYLYHEYVLPYEKRMVDAVHSMGSTVRLHICGNINSILDDISTLGVDMIDIDSLTDISSAREKLGSEVVILGNMDPVEYLLQGTPEMVKSVLAGCHNKVGDRFVVGAGCEVPPGTPHENLLAMSEYRLES